MKMVKIICITAIVFGMASIGSAEMEKSTAQIVSLDGKAEVKAAGQANWSPASAGAVLNEGDTLKTDANSTAMLQIGEKGRVGTVEMSRGSQLMLAEMSMDAKEDSAKTLLDLAMGEILIKAQKIHGEKSSFEVKTPTSIVGVRGTTFKVKVEAVEE